MSKKPVALKKRVKAGTSKEAALARKVKFAHAYIANGQNGTDAAIEAGCPPAGAHVAAARMLKDPKVQEIIAEATKKALGISGITVERTLQELARLAYGDIRKLYGKNGELLPVHQLDDDAAAMLAGVEVVEMTGGAAMGGEAGVEHVPMYTKKVKIWDKNSALDKAMKYLKMVGSDTPTPITNNTLVIMDDNNRLEIARRLAFVLARGAKLAK